MEDHFEEEIAAFAAISEDILINIFSKLEDDPRYLANLACVCTRFDSLIRTICWKKRCLLEIPSVVGDLLQTARPAAKLEEPPGGWAALQKLAVCCPGLWHAGVLLESWDYGLERNIGPSEHFKIETPQVQNPPSIGEATSEIHTSWTLFDDLHFDVEYQAEVAFVEKPSEERVSEDNVAENQNGEDGHGAREEPCGFGESTGAANSGSRPAENPSWSLFSGFIAECPVGENGHGLGEELCECELYPHGENASANNSESSPAENLNESQFSAENPNSSEPETKRKESPCLSPDECCFAEDSDGKKRKKRGDQQHRIEPHLATGVWNLTREQGNKLLQSRFRGDSLYICDWPGCIHSEEKRDYRLFRGIFKNFKNSHVWRNVKDLKAKKTVLNCAFCSSKGTWDMLNTFCLRRSLEYHENGEPAVRAYVCENGHVAGAWTDRPMYN